MPRIIAQTPDFLVIDKPAGLIAHRDGRTDEPSLAEWLGMEYPELRGVGGAWVSPQGEAIALNGLVHRLDRTTSGVVLVAKNDATFSALRQVFRERGVEKEYRAIVYGHFAEDRGVISAAIVRTKTTPKQWQAQNVPLEHNRAAITRWTVLERGRDEYGNPVSFMALFPQTGRTHQLRVHLAHIGHPIVADHVYALKHPAVLGFSRPALHAFRISFSLASTAYSFTAPVPRDFEVAIQQMLHSGTVAPG